MTIALIPAVIIVISLTIGNIVAYMFFEGIFRNNRNWHRLAATHIWVQLSGIAIFLFALYLISNIKMG